MTRKLYISADIEGVAGICAPSETDMACTGEYEPFRKQMTAEVAAACAGAFAAGIEAIVVKDAHWTGRNIDPHQLTAPEGKTLELIRGWSGHPFSMVQDLDASFEAVAFVGYHSAAGRGGNPLAHTFSNRMFAGVELNGQSASEFVIYAHAAASVGVPAVFLSGDAALCAEAEGFNDGLVTVATFAGVGSSVRSLLPAEATRRIQAGIGRALALARPRPRPLPAEFHFKLRFHKATDAYARSFYPGARQVTDLEVVLETKRYLDVLTFLQYASR